MVVAWGSQTKGYGPFLQMDRMLAFQFSKALRKHWVFLYNVVLYTREYWIVICRGCIMDCFDTGSTWDLMDSRYSQKQLGCPFDYVYSFCNAFIFRDKVHDCKSSSHWPFQLHLHLSSQKRTITHRLCLTNAFQVHCGTLKSLHTIQEE